MSIQDTWLEVYRAINKCDSIAWDGCHKIYVSMDEEQTEKLREDGYAQVVTTKQSSYDHMTGLINKWYEESSCGLRFIEQISTDKYKTEFRVLIPQFFSEEIDK